MEEIQDLLSRLESLTAEEIGRLTDLINGAYDTANEAESTPETVATMRGLVDAATTVRGEQTRREEAAAAAQAEADAIRAEMDALRNPEEEPTTLTPTAEDGEEETPEEVDPEADPANPEGETPEGETPEGEVLPIAAAAVGGPAARQPRAARMVAANGRAAQRPDAEPIEPARGAVVVAGAGLRDLNPGDEIADSSILAAAMCDMLMGLDRDSQPTGRHTVARARWADAYPEDRRLGRDMQQNSDRIEAVCAPRAVLASGGTCLPVNVDYTVPTWADANRPLRDGLPGYQADRGGIRFVSPPDVGVVDLQGTATGAGTATRVWTEATDAAPAGQTKPVWTVTCGAEQLVYVNAVPTRVQFGNMFGRFAPEQVAANTEIAIDTAAREAELELLTLMFNASKQVKPQQYLGATRDLLASAGLLVSQYRYSHRIPKTATFCAVFPEWAREVVRADMAREIAHDNAGAQNVLAITDAQIEEWFSARGITSIIWTEDGLKAGTYGTGGSAITNQFFPILAGGAPEPQWPGETTDGAFMLAWLLYVEGSYQFLDGGRLDLGVVRDSTLDATNDYETFVETFEGLAFRGLEVYQVQSTILPTGGSAGSVAVAGYHE